MAWRNHLVESSPNTNVHPAFGSQAKIMRNVKITQQIVTLNQGGMSRTWRGNALSEASSDPLRRDPRIIVARRREEASIFGRSRGVMRPAAPGQVAWKNSYWIQQRTRATRPTAIGPYTQGSLEKQSVLYRISDGLSSLARGGR